MEPRKSILALGADALSVSGRPHRSHRHREMPANPARSKTLRMHGNTLHGNREIPPSSGQPSRSRPHREVERREPMMHGDGKSDTFVVPQKLPNKAGDQRRRQWREGRWPRGTRPSVRTPDTVPGRCAQSLDRVRSAQGLRPYPCARRYHPRQEPDAAIPHVRICAGGAG